MSSVAAQLRAAREAQHLSLEQLADLTKMRSDHILAIEEGRFDTFSATIYVRGSVKNIAGILKVDPKPLLAQLDAELNGSEKFSEPPPLVESKKTIVDYFTILFAKLNWLVGFAGIAIISGLVLLGLIFWAWHHHATKDYLKDLPPAYSTGGAGNTLPLPKK
jgi:cytoskeletal protein RodZ